MTRQRGRPADVQTRRILDAVPPASGAVVMGTGIVSIALLLDHRTTLSDILLLLDAVTWVALALSRSVNSSSQVMAKTCQRFPVHASRRPCWSKARAYTMSSRELHTRLGEPSDTMR